MLPIAIMAAGHFELAELEAGLAQVFNQTCLIRRNDLCSGGRACLQPDIDLAVVVVQRNIKLAQICWYQRELQMVVARGVANNIS